MFSRRLLQIVKSRCTALLGTVGGRCVSQYKGMQPLSLMETSIGFPNLASDMMRLLDDMPLWSPKHFGVLPQAPLLDIKETPDAFEFVVDAPGVKKEDVKIEVRENILNIIMERKDSKTTDTEQFHRVERFSGRMQRSVRLPVGIKDEEISAKYEDGVLHITIPKAHGEGIDTSVKLIPVK